MKSKQTEKYAVKYTENLLHSTHKMNFGIEVSDEIYRHGQLEKKRAL